MRIGVGLSIPELATRGGKFSPLSLFSSGAKGAWYDPSDYSTLFQDSAGTTPVTAVEQPVGLMLDKSQGLVIGSEQIVNGSFATDSDWTKIGGATISGGVANLFNAATNPAITQTRNFTLGRTYLVSLTWTGTISAGMGNYGSGDIRFLNNSTAGSWTGYVTLSAGTGATFWVQAPINVSSTVDNISVKELAGNHASQSTAASRPVLRARYNQATYSEQVDNAAWNKGSIVTTGSWVNQLTAPDGTLTADLVRPNNVSGTHYALLNSTLPAVAGTYTCSLYVYAGGYTKFSLRESGSTGAYVSFDIATVSVIDSASVGTVTISSSSIAAVPGYPGWYRAVVTYVYSTGLTPNFGYWPLPTSYTTGQPASVNWAGDGTSGIYIWGAQIVTGSSAGTYQRIAAATDYATAGFLPYLAFDGSDDSMVTNTITPGIDKTQVFVGVSKLSDAASGMLVEFSAGSGNGRFETFAPIGAGAQNYYFSTGGTSFASNTVTTYAAPITNVFTGIGDIGADVSVIRINGAQVASNSANQGTGDYLAYPLYIGRRGGTSNPFNGRIYQLIVRFGASLSASELASTESFVATKTGVTL